MSTVTLAEEVLPSRVARRERPARLCGAFSLEEGAARKERVVRRARAHWVCTMDGRASRGPPLRVAHGVDEDDPVPEARQQLGYKDRIRHITEDLETAR